MKNQGLLFKMPLIRLSNEQRDVPRSEEAHLPRFGTILLGQLPETPLHCVLGLLEMLDWLSPAVDTCDRSGSPCPAQL